MTSEAAAVRPVAEGDSPHAGAWQTGALLREIARGGLAGLIAGILVAGVGGRLVMRLAALLVPDATGRLTENGNRIGDITLEGTVLLVVFMGLFAGTVGGVLWVTLRPWLPASTVPRILVAAPVAVALGTFTLIEATNPDFGILGFSPLIAALLVGLVALFGVAVATFDALLDARLPQASGRSPVAVAYALVAGLGLLLGMPLVVPPLLLGKLAPVGFAVLLAGAATLAWWVARSRGATRPSPLVAVAGRAGVAASVALGAWLLVPELAGALGA